jgi:glycerol kinase
MKYILALDQGTTSSRAIVFDQAGSVVAMEQQEFLQMFPQPGWVEHNPNEIWSTQREVALRAVRRANAKLTDIAAIGITNQRETTVVWDRRTGEPLCNAIVWQDRRTAAFCDKLKRRGLEKWVQRKTGLVIDAYFSASKLHWILHNVPNARRLADAGHLAFGTVDSWLIYKLSGDKTHVTDASNASRTMLMHLKTCEWDDTLLKEFKVPPSMLPQIRGSSEVLAYATGELEGVPIAGVAGDQQAALFGQVCTRPGMVKNTYGTGCFMLMHTGTKAIASRKKLLSTVAWRIKDRTEYALEGSIFIGGAVVQWLRDGLGIIKSSAESESMAVSVPDTNGVYIVPAFAGLGAPHWDPYARGTIVGLTRGSSARHITRAGLESIAYQTADLLQAMEKDSGVRLKELRVDGGACINNFLMQFQADLLGVDVVRPQVTETTALGAAYLAGLAVGFWKSIAEIASQWSIEKRFTPAMKPDRRKKLLAGWTKAVRCAKGWATEG